MTTTIKVDGALRDRLRSQASRDGVTLGAHLTRLADADDRRERVRALGRQIASTPAEQREEWERETAEWERAELTDAER